MTAYLKAQVSERRARLERLSQQRAEIDREALIAEVELRAYEDALSHIEADSIHAELTSEANRPSDGGEDGEDNLTNAGGGSYNSRINPKSEEYAAARMTASWRAIISGMMEAYPRATSFADMLKNANRAGAPLSEKSIRGGAATYAARGWLERVRPGYYRPTVDGAKAAGVGPKELNFSGSEASGSLSLRNPSFV